MGLDPRALGIVVCSVVLNVLAVLAVWGRIWARRMRKAPIKGDDWVIIAALVLSVFQGIFGIWASASGVYTTPLRQMTPSEYKRSRKVQFTEVLVVHLAVGLIKISVLLFYNRFFGTIKWFRTVSNGFMLLVSVWIVASFFSVIGSFKGVSSYWTAPPSKIRAYENIDYAKFIVVTAGIDVAMDIAILSLPLFVIRTLHMNFSRKIKVSAIFMLGAFCLIASIVRLYYANQLVSFTNAQIATQAFINAGLNQTLWARIEVSVSVATACLPSLAPIFDDGSGLFTSVLNSMSSVFSGILRSTDALDEESREQKSSPAECGSSQ